MQKPAKIEVARGLNWYVPQDVEELMAKAGSSGEVSDFIDAIRAVPPRRYHLVCYHGVFAPNASWRGAIVPRPPEAEARCAGALSEGPVLPPGLRGSKAAARPRPPFPTALG